MGIETPRGAVLRHLNELKEALERDGGLSARVVHTNREVPPRLLVTNRHAPSLSEMISCEPNVMDSCRFYFAFSWGEPVAPASEADLAAKDITRVLGAGEPHLMAEGGVTMGKRGSGDSDDKTPTDGSKPQGGKRGSGGGTDDNKGDGKKGK